MIDGKGEEDNITGEKREQFPVETAALTAGITDEPKVAPDVGGEQKKAGSKAAFKVLVNVLFLLLSAGIIAWIAISEFGGSSDNTDKVTFAAAAQQVIDNRMWLLFAVLMLIVFALCDMGKVLAMSYSSTKRFRPFVAYKAGAIGRYYDNITPFGAGGQPFQIHYLSQKMSGGAALSTVLATFFIQQMSFVLAAPTFLVFASLEETTPIWTTVIMWIGYVFFAAVPIMILILTLKEKTARKMVDIFLRMLKKLRLIRDYDKTAAKTHKFLDDYKVAVTSVSKNIPAIIIGFAFSILQFFLYFWIPCTVMLACGVEVGALKGVFSQMVAIHFMVAILPSPGGAGASEGTFYIIFKELLAPLGMLFWGVTLWRFLIFYFFIIQGFIIVLVRTVSKSVAKVRMSKQIGKLR
ncbi:MAG: flippase-like domain-containing protein [Clostridiales bacterium]|jgi:uncharacterized protein (TIRG00374 family)|nr:flippase-like domain-containing protein [Clostridiales bacterium]